jgi:hypothetical protein
MELEYTTKPSSGVDPHDAMRLYEKVAGRATASWRHFKEGLFFLAIFLN